MKGLLHEIEDGPEAEDVTLGVVARLLHLRALDIEHLRRDVAGRAALRVGELAQARGQLQSESEVREDAVY